MTTSKDDFAERIYLEESLNFDVTARAVAEVLASEAGLVYRPGAYDHLARQICASRSIEKTLIAFGFDLQGCHQLAAKLEAVARGGMRAMNSSRAKDRVTS